MDLKSIDKQTGLADLPNELLIHVATGLDPTSLARLEQTSRRLQQLIRAADARCWAHHCGHGASVHTSLRRFIRARANQCLDSLYWEDVSTWKQVASRSFVLDRNWSSASYGQVPDVQSVVLGYRPVSPSALQPLAPITRSRITGRPLNLVHANSNSSYVWRAKLDTHKDAEFVVTTWLSGGLRVIDARKYGSGQILWELPRWSVRPYAHLEYRDGVACWDSERGIEVWKRSKLVQSSDPDQDEVPNKRGRFVHVGTIPDVPGMRGFMLNEALHLGISTQSGTTYVYDVRPSEPKLLTQFPIKERATGHIEHDLRHSIYAMGHDGYSLYEKANGRHVGDLNFRQGGLTSALMRCAGTNTFYIDEEDVQRKSERQMENRDADPDARFITDIDVLPGSAEHLSGQVAGGAQSTLDEILDAPDLDVATLLARRRRTRKVDLQSDEWGFASIRLLSDGAMLLVARSMCGRFLFCTDLLGLLDCLANASQEMIDAKVQECVSIVECGGPRCMTEFHAGGWLAVHGNRAAWEIGDKVYICPLPYRRNSIFQPQKMPLVVLNGRYAGEVPMPNIQVPVSFMSMHEDCLVMTYLHPAYLWSPPGDQNGQADWEMSMLKSIRIVRFAHPGLLERSKAVTSNGLDSVGAGQRSPESVTLGRRDLAVHERWQAMSRTLANQGAIGEDLDLFEIMHDEEWSEDEEEDFLIEDDDDNEEGDESMEEDDADRANNDPREHEINQ